MPINVKGLILILAVNIMIRTLFEYPSAIIAGALCCFGYQPKYAWLGLIAQCVRPLGVLAAILCGLNVLGVVLVELLLPSIVGFIIFWWIIRRWAKTNQIWGWLTDFKKAFRLWLYSLLNFGKDLSEMFRQQGIQLILAPMSGVAGLTAFATMRTGANVALQGLGTITSPLMPELMRFLNQRDQVRTEAAFATVWLLLMAILAPGVIFLQLCIRPLFELWTRGKVVFDPALFALMSLGVLVYAMAQPAMAVVQGNNLLKPQLVVSSIAGILVILVMCLLVPRIGILGSGLALLAGEVVAAVGYLRVASRWLKSNGLSWPKSAYASVILSVVVSGCTMLGIAWLPQWHFVCFLIGFAILIFSLKTYLRHLPDVARQRLLLLVSKLPGARRLGRLCP
jgi:O-antigen/teichoic acid export membrane protein